MYSCTGRRRRTFYYCYLLLQRYIARRYERFERNEAGLREVHGREQLGL
jgi:hypothetical protein